MKAVRASDAMILTEKEFLRTYQREYGYGDKIEKIRKEELSRLKDFVYLDSTGAALYPQRLLDKFYKDLSGHVYGNPHSRNSSSQQSTDAIEQARNIILQQFNTTPDKYSVIFTAGATSALKLIAESFDWHSSSVRDGHDDANSNRSCFCFLEDNHTSVVGMREVAASHGAHVCCVKSKTEELTVLAKDCNQLDKKNKHLYFDSNTLEVNGEQCGNHHKQINVKCRGHSSASVSNLFAFPALCNFSGRKFPLQWVTGVQEGSLIPCPKHCRRDKWFVLLDAASFISTSRLDLGNYPVDFVPLSFYKMFGFPTGLGALVVKNTSVHVLQKCYYGGGTVLATITTDRFHLPKSNISERFEDGTVSFLDIVALRHGFDTLQGLTGGIEAISSHTFSLAQYVHHTMRDLRHYNGREVCKLYCDTEFNDVATQGPVISFNICRASGEYVGYSEVEKMASLYNIHLRTGCFCNTGACQRHLGMSNEQVKTNLSAGHVCGDNMDLINGAPTGAVRISFGYMSNFSDAETFLNMIIECFVEKSEDSSTCSGNNCCADHERLVIPVKESQNNYNAAVGGSERKVNSNDILKSESQNLAVSPVHNHKTLIRNPWSGEDNGSKGFSLQDSVTGKSTSAVVGVSRYEEADDRGLQSQGDVGVPDVCPHNIALWNKDASRPDISSDDTNQCYNPVDSLGVCDVADTSDQALGRLLLQRICLYPIKSCAAFEVTEWEISPRGFAYDRQWMVVNESGACLSQKREPRLCLVKPTLDLPGQTLLVTAPGMKTLEIPFTCSQGTQQKCEATLCPTRVCGDRVVGLDCGQEAALWFSEFLGKTCRLLQQNAYDIRKCKSSTGAVDSSNPFALSLANESQFLLISRASARDLLSCVTARNTNTSAALSEKGIIDRFRPNIVISGTKPYQEDFWKKVTIGSQEFQCLGPCSRCQMVCVDQKTGERGTEPLKTLAQIRGSKIPFGIYLLHSLNKERPARLQVGDFVQAD